MSEPSERTESPLSWYVLLGLLAIDGGCAHGYPLTKACGAHGWLGATMRMESGMVYHHLKRMTQAGWVEERDQSAPEDLRRRCYAITESGERALWSWLDAPQRIPERVRPDLLVKLDLVVRLAPDAFDRIVHAHIDAHTRFLAEMPRAKPGCKGERFIPNGDEDWTRLETEAIVTWLRDIRTGPSRWTM